MLDELDERAISKGQLPREKSAIRQQRCRTSVSWLPLQQHWLDRWKAKTYPAFIDSSPPHISRCELRSAQPHPRISGPAFRLKKYQKYLQDGARGLTHSQPLQDGRRGVPAGCRLRIPVFLQQQDITVRGREGVVDWLTDRRAPAGQPLPDASEVEGAVPPLGVHSYRRAAVARRRVPAL